MSLVDHATTIFQRLRARPAVVPTEAETREAELADRQMDTLVAWVKNTACRDIFMPWLDSEVTAERAMTAKGYKDHADMLMHTGIGIGLERVRARLDELQRK